MIFVTLGTQDKSFERLLKKIDLLIRKGIIQDEVIVQAGFTKYETDNMKIMDFISNEDFEKYIKNCNYMITHGGVGSILTGLKNQKKVIAVARQKKYDEHTNDHQFQIINKFGNSKYIIGVDNLNKLESAVKNIGTFVPSNYVFDNSNIITTIKNYIDKY